MSENHTIDKTEHSFEILFYQNPQPMWIVEISTLRFLAVNGAAIVQYGYTEAEFLKLTLCSICPVTGQCSMNQLFNRIKNLETVSKEITHLKKSGEKINVQATSYNINYQQRDCRMVIINNITDRKIKDDKLKDAWFIIRQTLESVTDGFLTLNSFKSITYYNKEAALILGVKREAALNRNIFSVFPDLLNSKFHRAINKSANNIKLPRFEQYLPTLNKWICITIYYNRMGMAIYFTDISKEKTDQWVIELKNRRLNEIAYLNSHSIRKEVANIIGLVNLMEIDFATNADADEYYKLLKISAENLDTNLKSVNIKTEC